MIPKNLKGLLRETENPNRVRRSSKTSALLGTATILKSKVSGLDQTKSRKCCYFQDKEHLCELIIIIIIILFFNISLLTEKKINYKYLFF